MFPLCSLSLSCLLNASCSPCQICDREREIRYLFGGSNTRTPSAITPIVLFAPVGSGKSTLLIKGQAVQEAAIRVEARFKEQGQANREQSASQVVSPQDDITRFLQEFAQSIGLQPRSPLTRIAVLRFEGLSASMFLQFCVCFSEQGEPVGPF